MITNNTWLSSKSLKPLPISLYLPTLCLMAHAAQSQRKSAILTDLTAWLWFNALASLYKEMPNPESELINGIITRSMIIDYAVLDCLNNHKQRRLMVIDAGCGFSTRYYRLGLEARVRSWAHVDLAEVIEARRGLQKLDKHEQLLACDLTDGHAFAWGRDVLVICEGLLNHMPMPAAQALVGMFEGAIMIGTLMYESALEKINSNAEGLGTRFPLWGLSAAEDLQKFLGQAQVSRTWLLGKAARMIGLVRPERDDEASGVVFLAKL